MCAIWQCSRSARMWKLPNYWQMTKNSQTRLSLCSRLSGLLSTTPKCIVLCASCLRTHLYGHPCSYTQPYSSDQSWAFWTCSRAYLLCPPDNDTDYMYIRKLLLRKTYSNITKVHVDGLGEIFAYKIFLAIQYLHVTVPTSSTGTWKWSLST